MPPLRAGIAVRVPHREGSDEVNVENAVDQPAGGCGVRVRTEKEERYTRRAA
jgi:hypothetical protein